MPDLDWSEMEGLFCQQAPMAPTSQSGVLNFRLGQDNNECDKRRKEPTEVKHNRFCKVLSYSFFFSKIHF